MKILVTGGAGFIGKNLVGFLQSNHEVTIYDNLSNSSIEDIRPLIIKGAKFVQADILDHTSLQKSCAGFDVIIHLAAQSDVAESLKNPEFTNEVNVAGTTNVLKCCAKNKIKKLIFASSAAVYGNLDYIVDENTTPNPLSPYGQSKLDAEIEIEKFAKQNDIDAVSLRMFNVYDLSYGKHSGVISKFVENVSNDLPIIINGDGKQTRDFIFIEDIVSAFDCAIKNIDGKKGNVYNIATGSSVSIEEIAELIVAKSGKEIEIKHQAPVQGDIKNSKASVVLAEKELGFVAKHNVVDDLSEIFKK